MSAPRLAAPLRILASAVCRDLKWARQEAPEVWRASRRYDPPVQAALVAAHLALPADLDPARLATIALAPCNAGSAEMFAWVRRIEARQRSGEGGLIRMNPVHTLHAVDNLALSALSIARGLRGYGASLGGAPGQAWAALEMAAERLADGPEARALVFGGDQDSGERGGGLCGVALLLARADEAASGATLERLEEGAEVDPPLLPHATRDLAALLEVIQADEGPAWSFSASQGAGLPALTLGGRR